MRIQYLYKKVEKLNSLKVERILRERGISIFSPLDFVRLFRVSFFSAKNFINRHTSTGLFLKVKNGLYVLAEKRPPKFILANKVYYPSYISFETALSYHHIIPESIYTVFSATPKATREFEVLETSYVYHRIKKELFFGYTAQKIENMTFLIAEPEKALVDYLYFVDLKKKCLIERIDVRRVKKIRVSRIAKLFGREGLVKLIDHLYDKSKSN